MLTWRVFCDIYDMRKASCFCAWRVHYSKATPDIRVIEHTCLGAQPGPGGSVPGPTSRVWLTKMELFVNI